MGLKLRLSTGKCACSNCYQSVEPTATFCDSCGTLLEGEMEAKKCPSCETLISLDAQLCPICNEKQVDNPGIQNEMPVTKQLAKEDEEFLVKVMGWAKSWEDAAPDTKEDVQERDRALKVLQSIATIEPDETMEEHIKDIEETAIERDGFEKRRKQLMKLGRPFETLLERNTANMSVVDQEIIEKTEELASLEGKAGKKAEEERPQLERKIKMLEKKKAAMMSYESNILMIGGAYRSILGAHQNELLRLEADLKKRVDAFQKEVERRKKQKEKLRNREEALDKREEELSHRFLELKSRENEITVRENNLQKIQRDLDTKEEELKTWESEIDTNRKNEGQVVTESAQTTGSNREEWLAAQRKFQADLFGLKDDMPMGELTQITGEGNYGIKDARNNLEEKKLEEVLKQLGELKNQILEKDKEIESLKEDGTEFNVDEETRKILKILDDLLENLPDEVVDEFARSDDYLLYEKILEKYKL